MNWMYGARIGNMTGPPGGTCCRFTWKPGSDFGPFYTINPGFCSYIQETSNPVFMKKPFLFFAIKASIIVYFAACTGIDHYTTAKSATPIVTRGSWKANLNGGNDQANAFAGYTFTFNEYGIVKATKNGVDINGNWFEDNISNRININFGEKDPSLAKLNTYWNITQVSNLQVGLQNSGNTANDKLNLTSL